MMVRKMPSSATRSSCDSSWPRWRPTYHSGNSSSSRRSSASSYGGSTPGRVASCHRSNVSVASRNKFIRVVGVERAQVGGRPQVGQQKETALDVLRDDLRRVHARRRASALRRARMAGNLRAAAARPWRSAFARRAPARAEPRASRGSSGESLRPRTPAPARTPANAAPSPATRRGGGIAGRRREDSSNEVGLSCRTPAKPGRKSRRRHDHGHRRTGLAASVGLECFILANWLWLHS